MSFAAAAVLAPASSVPDTLPRRHARPAGASVTWQSAWHALLNASGLAELGQLRRLEYGEADGPEALGAGDYEAQLRDSPLYRGLCTAAGALRRQPGVDVSEELSGVERSLVGAVGPDVARGACVRDVLKLAAQDIEGVA